jgi:hypothetical protein
MILRVGKEKPYALSGLAVAFEGARLTERSPVEQRRHLRVVDAEVDCDPSVVGRVPLAALNVDDLNARRVVAAKRASGFAKPGLAQLGIQWRDHKPIDELSAFCHEENVCWLTPQLSCKGIK